MSPYILNLLLSVVGSLLATLLTNLGGKVFGKKIKVEKPLKTLLNLAGQFLLLFCVIFLSIFLSNRIPKKEVKFSDDANIKYDKDSKQLTTTIGNVKMILRDPSK